MYLYRRIKLIKKMKQLFLSVFFTLSVFYSLFSQNKSAAPIIHGVYSHTAAMYNDKGGKYTFEQRISPLFPDTSESQMFYDRPDNVRVHGVGAVLDTKSNKFDIHFSNLPFNLDSVYITGYYVVKNKNIVDTLQLEVVYGSRTDSLNNPLLLAKRQYYYNKELKTNFLY